MTATRTAKAHNGYGIINDDVGENVSKPSRNCGKLTPEVRESPAALHFSSSSFNVALRHGAWKNIAIRK